MTESSFPFGTEGQAAPLDDHAEESGRKPLLLVGGLVGALVLGAGAFFFLGGGDDAEEDFFVAPRKAPPAAAAPAEPQGVAVIPAATDETVGRNPFKARYIAPVAAAAPAEAPAAAPVAAPPPAPINLVISQPAPAPAPATKEEEIPATYKLTLKGISDPQPEARFVTWTYEDKDVTVLPGQRFGKYGELVVLAFTQNAEGAVDGVIIQVGDDSPFDAKLGQTYDVL